MLVSLVLSLQSLLHSLLLLSLSLTSSISLRHSLFTATCNQMHIVDSKTFHSLFIHTKTKICAKAWMAYPLIVSIIVHTCNMHNTHVDYHPMWCSLSLASIHTCSSTEMTTNFLLTSKFVTSQFQYCKLFKSQSM